VNYDTSGPNHSANSYMFRVPIVVVHKFVDRMSKQRPIRKLDVEMSNLSVDPVVMSNIYCSFVLLTRV
jgi:hypothetical protein